jgi:hypothetical protein
VRPKHENEPRLVDAARATHACDRTARQQAVGTYFWPAALVVLGLVTRAIVLASRAGRLDSDEAVVALMALRMRDGHMSLFYWGQHYGGVVEQLLVAASLSLHRSILFVKLVPFALSAALGVIVWRCGLRVFVRDRGRARIAGALSFAWPGTVWLATKERGFYWVSVVLVAAAFLVMLRIRDGGAHPARWDCVLLGLVGGVAWYETAQSAFVLIPLAVWYLMATRPRGRTIALVALGAAVGAAPWLVGLARYGWDVLRQPRYRLAYTGRLRVVVGQLLPRIAGVRGTYRGGWLLAGGGLLLWCAAVAGVTVAAVIVAARVARRGVGDPLVAVFVVVVAFPFIAATARATWYAAEPRYALPIVPFAALLFAAWLTSRIRVVMAIVVVGALAGANTASVLGAAGEQRAGVDLAPSPLGPLRHALATRRVTRAYADYWIAYPLTFAGTGPYAVVAAPLDRPRSVEIQRAVTDARARVWIVYARSPRDRALPGELATHGVSATRSIVGDFAVYRLDRFVDPQSLGSFWRIVHDGR